MAARRDVSKEISGAQAVALRCGSVLAVIALVLVVRWASGRETQRMKMLGGLDASHLFSWHPVLMVLGYTICMGFGLQAFRSARLGRPRNKRLHASLHGCALVCVCLALRAVFEQHNAINAPNLYTAHGIIGLTVCVLFFAQYLVAALAFLSDVFVSQREKSILLAPHVLIGFLTYFGSVVAIVSGVAEKTAWMGCGYYHNADAVNPPHTSLDAPDTNPAAHYPLLPLGCKLGIGVSVTALLSAFCLAIGVLSLKVGRDSDTAYQPLATLPPSPQGASSGSSSPMV
ncbi:hypothetical protein CTAYLR_002978 [Chrysophaeum taylorii]|uniref:Cytochrome b561 domain-containing protein n=1 Tax=Chrysophaeum taylorii TaxID=2483200 RepID=A0AAD7XEM9_9STRA|nr:hypothetical protein CTAYLR_002978 [Chrysophaeum taylorii]